MKQSTFSAVMANNLLTVLQGYSKTIRLLLVMFLTLTASTAWGATETITITQTALGLSGSYTSSSKTIDGVTFDWTDLMKNSSNIQAKASSGAIWNSSPIPGNIVSVAVTHSGTARSSTMYFGASEKSTTEESTFSGTATIEPNDEYKYFYIKRSSNAAYWTKIVITYETTPAVNHAITWEVNGETYTTGSPTTSVPEGSKVTILPTAPTLDCSGKTFVGWSNQEVTDGNKPSVLFTTAENSPAINADTTFYAVFATNSGGGEGEISLTASDFGLTTSYATKTATVDGYSFTIDQGYLNGTNNIQMNSSRGNGILYNTTPIPGLSTITLNVASGTNTKTLYSGTTQQPTTSVGTTISTKTFSIPAGNTYFKIGVSGANYFSSIVITYSTTSYSDYTTSCTTETAVTLNPNGGTIDDGNWAEDNGAYTLTTEEASITLPTITRTGYTFSKWTTNEDGTGTSYNEGDAINLDGTSVTLYAQWECAMASISISGAYALTQGQEFLLTATAKDSEGNEIECPDDAIYTWQYWDGSNWQDVNDNESSDKTKLQYASCNVVDHCGKFRCIISYGDCIAYSNTNTQDDGYKVHVYHIKGFGEWSTPYPFIYDANTGEAVLTMELEAYTPYEFSIFGSSTQFFNGGTITANATDLVYGLTNYGNTKITTTIAGVYIFTLDYSEGESNNLKLDVTYPSKRIIYLEPNIWGTDPKFAVHAWGGNSTEDILMTKIDDCASRNIYYAEIDASQTNVTFIRGNTDNYDISNPWENVWNQTVDLTLGNDNLFYVDNWHDANDYHKSNGYWTTFTPNYSVTFDVQGHGTAPEDQCIAEGGTATTPTAPTATGYTFGGWYKEAGCTNAYDFSTAVTSSIPLYAKWTVNTHTLTWNVNGGNALTGTYTSGAVDYGAAITKPTDPTRTGYTFQGWHDGTSIVTPATTMPDKDLTYTAQWKLIPTLSWSASSCTAALEADNDYPKLTTSPADLTGITYSSLNTSVATIDENTGEITLKADGETTITASFAGNGTYAPAADASYTLTVVESNCRWVEAEIGDIQSGDEVVITMTGVLLGKTYALPNNEVTNDQTDIVPTSVTVANRSLQAVSEDIIWFINKIGDNLTFESYLNTGKFLTCTSANKGIRVNTGDNKQFVIDQTYNYLKNITTSRYLGVHNEDHIWYSYALTDGGAFPAKINGQTLKFYKRECLDSEHYWVTWDANGGQWTDGSTKKLESYQVGAPITAPTETPTREGYRFDGWSPEPTTMPAENTTFTAVWTQMHTITWMVGSNSVLTEEVANATGVTQTPSDPADGAIGSCANKFMGWSETPLGSAEGQSAPSDLCTAADMKSKHSSVTGDKTFYAVFASVSGSGAPTAYTAGDIGNFVLAAKNGSKWYALPANPTVSSGKIQGVEITVTTTSGVEHVTTANASGYTWTIANATNGQTISDGSKYIYHSNGGASGTNLEYGNGTSYTWKIEKESAGLTFKAMNGTTTNSRGMLMNETKFGGYALSNEGASGYYRISILSISDGVSYSNYVTNCCELLPVTNLQVSDVTESSATLTWTKPSSITGITELQVRNAEMDTVVVDNIDVNTTTATITGLSECTEYKYYVVSVGDCEVVSDTITAQPFSGAKTVTFNPNGGAVSPTSFTTSCYKKSTTLPTPTYSGYRFMGWFTAESGGTEIDDDPYTPTEDITLFAHWEKEYTVTYDANGGSTTCANGNYIEGETVTLCTSTPSKTGYTFADWTYSPEVTITDGKFTMPASDVTITAQWNINQYTVTWEPNGGNWAGSTENIVHTYDYGATINRPADPTRDGYRFIGWNTTVESTMPATNITYTAQWKQNYTITFHDGDDTTPWTQTADAESIDLNNYVGTHACGEYDFAGWSTASTQYNDQTANITTWVTGTYTPTASIDLYAVYVKGDLATDFTLNCDGGVYEIWEKGHNQHMAGRQNGGGNKFYTTEYWDANNSESNGAPFTIIKVADNTYTLQNADGQYITGNSYDEDDLNIEDTWENADKYMWTISAGSNGNWRFTNKAATSYALVYYNNVYFELRLASSVTAGNTTTYDLELTPAQSNVYQSNPNCGPYYIIFNTHGGEFIQGDEYPYGKEKTGLTETTYAKFPAAELEGYTFAGWKDGSPQEDINYEPLLKKPDDNLVVSSNKTYHAVYYYYDEEEDIDWSEEFTTGIYADVNGIKYFLAGTPDRGTMSSTTDCGYVSEVTITPGTGENAGKYKITVNGVGMAPEAGETDLVDGTAWWTITETSVGSGEYKISGEDKRNIVLRNSSFGHYSYNAGSSYGAGYYYPRFGKCLEHHWTSDPAPKPSIKLSGDIYITATNSRAVRATETIKVVANNLSAGESITLTSNSSDVYFSTDRTFNFAAGQAANQKPTTSLILNANADGNLETDVYVHYNPSTDGDDVPTDVVVTATVSSVSKNHTIHVRNLPAKFVIATKVGATWYALPADMTDDTNPLAEVIEVDEATMTATAPNTTTYTLWPVKTTNSTGNRYADYGDRLRFAAVNYEQRGLWANNNNNSSAIKNYAVINSLGADALAAYEWKVTTTVVDGHWQYTLQTDQTQNKNYLRYWTSAEGTPVGPKWGTYNAGENKLYFLPVTETQPFEYAVVEWYPTKMLIQTDAAITNPIVKIGGILVDNVTCTNKGGKLYEISNLPLETNPNKVLQVSFTADAVNYVNAKVVPIILSRGAKSITGEPFATLTQKVYQYADVVVRDGATLTIDGGTDVANTLLGMTIYPTAKVSVADGKKLSVHNLTFFGGIDEIYDGSAYTINKYGVPQLSLKGILNKTVTTMDYIMRVNLDQMYQVGVPYDVNLSDITYWDGTAMTLGDNLYVSAYDGQKRANREEKSWVWEVNFTEPILKVGIGYTISADMQAGVGNEYSIIRMPMKNNITSGNTETAKTVQVYAYDNTKGVEITDNHKGWNYLSNPYMVAISGAEDSKLVVGYLRETGTGPWEWVNDEIRYVTIPHNDGEDYDQQKFSEATLLPFKSFFLQIAQEGDLSFALANRQAAPARYLQQAADSREVEFEILLANDTRSDNMGLLISEDYTPAYEINADLEKMIGSMSVYTIYNGYNLAYNALSPINAQEQIPIGYVVPDVGEYTFKLDENADVENIEHIYLNDFDMNVVTDLLEDEYTFYASEKKSEARFVINVIMRSEQEDDTPTGLEELEINTNQPIKFFYQDKLYILRNGIIYDAMGKQVQTINK